MATEEKCAHNVTTDKKSLLLQAITDNDVSMVTELIVQQRVSPNFYLNNTTPVCTAATEGNVEVLEILLKGNCILNTPNMQDSVWHRQPIHIAASQGHIDFLKQLIDSDVNVNSSDIDGRTALHWAVIYKNKDVIEYLLSLGADINYCQTDGFTALYAAACFGHADVCTILVKKGANVHLTDTDGWTALHTAVCYGHFDVVKSLVEAGTSLTTLTKDGENTLHIAASSGNLRILKYLVSRKIQLNDQTLNGMTAFHLGIFHNKYSICKYLLEAGADIQTSNKFGQSICHDVAVRMDKKFLYLLLDGGYNFSKESWIHNGTFPITTSKSSDYEDTCQLLRFLASNPRSLRDACCLKLRKVLGTDLKKRVELLPVPQMIKKIIVIEDL